MIPIIMSQMNRSQHLGIDLSVSFLTGCSNWIFPRFTETYTFHGELFKDSKDNAIWCSESEGHRAEVRKKQCWSR